ncbi:GNAT family N-acetyltransferase [Prauserella rugosa]|uniref:Putative acetyltransferase n=1 Tax=Prauserella rugosa TaxID=43354 RepID=A0A660C6Y7_9PSEU|nr:GNAT family N-acetyltransferase [Prauserella rugosa]KMS88433.1 acetyltransferase [Streptomyces regensis]TWH19262.1 putative acetyltransferase [Prauserella rugosa]
MTDHHARILGDDEQRGAVELFRSALHAPPLTDEEWASARDVECAGRRHGVTDGDTGALIGTAWAWDTALTVPGGGVPLGAVTEVGVRADRTRRGVLSELMRAQLTDMAERGVVTAGLHASEATIYGRFGYGVGALARDYTVETSRAQLRPEAPAGGRVEIRDLETVIDLASQAYPAMATRPGMLARPAEWWGMLRAHLARRAEGRVTAVTHEGKDGIDGFAVYSVDRPKPGSATLKLVDLHTATIDAFAGLWRYLLSVDLIGEITATNRPVDEPLELLLADPRAVSTTARFDDLWLRLVDVPEALAVRAYQGDPLTVEVTDRLLPANTGSYLVGPDGVERTDRAPDLRLDVAALAMIHLGAWRPSQLVDTGRAQALTTRAASRADRLFSTPTAPWCGTFF